MIRLLTDENFNGHVLSGLRRLRPDMDVVRVQDMELAGTDDPGVLADAARMGRILLTHDAATVPDFAYDRVEQGDPMPGVLVVKWSLPIQDALEAILFFTDLADSNDVDGQVIHLPL